jgi:hypothetical protein
VDNSSLDEATDLQHGILFNGFDGYSVIISQNPWSNRQESHFSGLGRFGIVGGTNLRLQNFDN